MVIFSDTPEAATEATGGPTAAPAGGGGILSPDTLKAAQRAAEATGEAIPPKLAALDCAILCCP